MVIRGFACADLLQQLIEPWHAHTTHAICSSSAKCHGHADVPSITTLWPCTEAASLPCRSAAAPTNPPKWRHNAKPKASRLAGRSAAGKCSRALRSSAGHNYCHLLESWIGVERHRIHLPLLRWTEPARCHHQVLIGLIQIGFSLPHESHCDSKARENPT